MSVTLLTEVLALINTTSLEKYDEYVRGEQPLAFLSPDVQAQVGDRIPQLVLNVPRVVLGSIEERLDVEGFALTRNGDVDEALLDIWQANDLDEWSQICHYEALKHGISFVTVWSNPDNDDIPRIAVESATQMAVRFAPGTRRVDAAAKRWMDRDADGKNVERAVLYTPEVIEKYSRPAANTFAVPAAIPGLGSGGWRLDETLDNPLDEVPVVPFINRPSLTDMSGESELVDVMPLTDGVNKLLSDMMVVAEHYVEPRRYATGMQVPREAAQNARLREEVRQQWDEATRGKTWVAGEGVSFGQFASADLQNFKTGVDLILSKVAFITGLAPHMLGITTDNPASAEAIRSSESPLIRRVRRKMRTFGGSWERVMRLALKVRDGSVPDEALSMETRWANPETRTFAQDADAVSKLTAGDNPVLTVRVGREVLGFSPTAIKRMEDETAAAAATAATGDVAARMDQARALQQRDGLTQPAALAAVGLLAAATAQGAAPAPAERT